jgi:hypothetical protein
LRHRAIGSNALNERLGQSLAKALVEFIEAAYLFYQCRTQLGLAAYMVLLGARAADRKTWNHDYQ